MTGRLRLILFALIPRRRWLRFGIRSLLAGVLIAALPLWWLRVQLDDLAAEHDAIVCLQRAGAVVVTSPAEPHGMLGMLPRGIMPEYEHAEAVFIDPDKIVGRQRVDIRQLGAETFALLGRFAALERLEIYNFPVTDEDLAACSNLKRLTYLNLSDCQRITARGLRHFAQSTELEHLCLQCTRIGDDVAGVLRGFRHLQWLDLQNTDISDDSMHDIVTLTELHYLSLPRGVTSRGLRDIQKLARLEELDLVLRKGDDVTALTSISRLPNLHSLTAWGNGLTDDGLRRLAASPRLKTLNIQAGNVSDEGIAWLKGLRQFQSIYVPLGGDDEYVLPFCDELATPPPPRRPPPASAIREPKQTSKHMTNQRGAA